MEEIWKDLPQEISLKIIKEHFCRKQRSILDFVSKLFKELHDKQYIETVRFSFKHDENEITLQLHSRPSYKYMYFYYNIPVEDDRYEQSWWFNSNNDKVQKTFERNLIKMIDLCMKHSVPIQNGKRTIQITADTGAIIEDIRLPRGLPPSERPK